MSYVWKLCVKKYTSLYLDKWHVYHGFWYKVTRNMWHQKSIPITNTLQANMVWQGFLLFISSLQTSTNQYPFTGLYYTYQYPEDMTADISMGILTLVVRYCASIRELLQRILNKAFCHGGHYWNCDGMRMWPGREEVVNLRATRKSSLSFFFFFFFWGGGGGGGVDPQIYGPQVNLRANNGAFCWRILAYV